MSTKNEGVKLNMMPLSMSAKVRLKIIDVSEIDSTYMRFDQLVIQINTNHHFGKSLKLIYFFNGFDFLSWHILFFFHPIGTLKVLYSYLKTKLAH